MSHFSSGHTKPLSFFTQIYISQRSGSMKQSDRVRILSHFPPSHESLDILSLVTLLYMYEMRIKRSESICWFYSCNSFYIFLNTIFKFRQQFCDQNDQKILALFHCHLFEYPTIKQAYVFSFTKSPSVLYLRLFIYLFFNGNLNNVILSMDFYV